MKKIKSNTLDNIINETIGNIISEEDNPAFDRSSKTVSSSLEDIWNVIDNKQEELQKDIFGALEDEILDITKEKAKSMGYDYLRVPRKICTAGNKKLPPSVLIINMSSSLMCPSFYLGICTVKSGACYAQTGENRRTTNVLPNRWQTDLMHTQMLQMYKKGDKKPMRDYFNIIETYIQLRGLSPRGTSMSTLVRNAVNDIKKRGEEITEEEIEGLHKHFKKYEISDVRLNETGDFQCQLAVDLWAKFAEKIRKKYGIKTHTYTARNLDFSKASKVMAVNTSHDGINVGDEKERKFRVVNDAKYDSLEGGDEVNNGQPKLGFKNGKYFYKCPCSGDSTECGDCRVCYDRNKTGVPYTIYVKYHGMTAANGLKSLFTKDEVKNVIEKLYKNGWITEEEYQSWSSERNQKRLDKLSRDITDKRKKNSKK